MMKKILKVAMALVMTLTLVSCGGKKEETTIQKLESNIDYVQKQTFTKISKSGHFTVVFDGNNQVSEYEIMSIDIDDALTYQVGTAVDQHKNFENIEMSVKKMMVPTIEIRIAGTTFDELETTTLADVSHLSTEEKVKLIELAKELQEQITSFEEKYPEAFVVEKKV